MLADAPFHTNMKTWSVVWNIFFPMDIVGIIIPIDEYVSEGLKPPTRKQIVAYCGHAPRQCLLSTAGSHGQEAGGQSRCHGLEIEERPSVSLGSTNAEGI